jgi:hypothetical protein
LVGIVMLNVVLAGAIFVRMIDKDQCDVVTRGLVVRIEDEERWQTFVPPPEGADVPPCRAETRTELVMLPE